jgi:hypothetical protein
MCSSDPALDVVVDDALDVVVDDANRVLGHAAVAERVEDLTGEQSAARRSGRGVTLQSRARALSGLVLPSNLRDGRLPRTSKGDVRNETVHPRQTGQQAA